jgi:aryl-alcohol dehydrogenase-like predicted oxidoreductase
MLDTPAWAVVKANVEHLEANVRALGISLTKEEIYDVDAALEFDPGFPMNFIFSE